VKEKKQERGAKSDSLLCDLGFDDDGGDGEKERVGRGVYVDGCFCEQGGGSMRTRREDNVFLLRSTRTKTVCGNGGSVPLLTMLVP
jgi:hypothetical protein